MGFRMVPRHGAAEARDITRRLQVMRLRPAIPCGSCPSCRHIEERKRARLREINERERQQPLPPSDAERPNRVMFNSNPVVHNISARENGHPLRRVSERGNRTTSGRRPEEEWRGGARPRNTTRHPASGPQREPVLLVHMIPRR